MSIRLADNSLGDADYYEKKQYAGFLPRLLVTAIDLLVLLIVGTVLWIPFAILIISGAIDGDPSGCFWLLYLTAIWVYLAPVKRSDFGSIGFKLLGIRLVNAKGGKPSLLTMTMRMTMWMFGPFSPVLDLLWLGADTEQQSLRDCYLSTYLVKRNSVPIGRAPIHLTQYYATGFTLSYPRVSRPKGAASQSDSTESKQ
ncbi:MAG: RDD family protein [Acidobacteria bacterium]|nr:RDD family protein [Acidobacteriota bacterium]